MSIADSTHSPAPSVRSLWALPATLIAVTALLFVHAPVAVADGDPASDVLAAQTLFLPQDAGVTARQQEMLIQLLKASARRGFPLRVAVIAGPTDLGSVAELWHHPAQYGRFLDEELSQVYRGPLLVVMPNGFGLAGPGTARPALPAALTALPHTPPGPALGRTTISAVQRLAAASGHPLPAVTTGSRSVGGSTDLVAVLALAIGAALMLAAWAVSFRIRPPRPGRPAPS